ncbi:MAG: hypothetical protein R2939_06240 [Kofleriaceae bacterium]
MFADPYALVRVDGVDLGPTPITRRSVSAGRHVVEAIDPASGAVRHRTTVDVADGGRATVRVP